MSTIYLPTKFQLDMCFNSGDQLLDRIKQKDTHTNTHTDTDTQTDTDTIPTYWMRASNKNTKNTLTKIDSLPQYD